MYCHRDSPPAHTSYITEPRRNPLLRNLIPCAPPESWRPAALAYSAPARRHLTDRYRAAQSHRSAVLSARASRSLGFDLSCVAPFPRPCRVGCDSSLGLAGIAMYPPVCLGRVAHRATSIAGLYISPPLRSGLSPAHAAPPISSDRVPAATGRRAKLKARERERVGTVAVALLSPMMPVLSPLAPETAEWQEDADEICRELAPRAAVIVARRITELEEVVDAGTVNAKDLRYSVEAITLALVSCTAWALGWKLIASRTRSFALVGRNTQPTS